METHGLIETIEKLIEAEDTTGVVEAVEISQAHRALQILSTDPNTALSRIDALEKKGAIFDDSGFLLLEYEGADQDWEKEQTVLHFEDSSRVVIDGLARSVTAFSRSQVEHCDKCNKAIIAEELIRFRQDYNDRSSDGFSEGEQVAFCESCFDSYCG